MKIQDLQKYKTLDITQLSGSPWNTAEKVLGLDSGDTVVMANRMDDEAKQYTDDAIASALTSYYTKDEVDEIVEDIDVTEQLTNYYTKGEVDTANAAQDERIENNENDIADLQSEMVNKSELETAMADETARTESTYAKPSDIPDLTPYATKGWVESKSYVNGAFVDTKVNEAITSETARTESVYAKKTDIPDMGEYATKDYVEGAMEVETARTESTYLKEHQSLDNYYTKSQVDTLIEDIDVSDQLANYALSSSVTEDINTAIANETARTESTYLKEHQSLDNYYTKAQVDSAITRVEEEIPLVPVNVSAFVNDAGYLTEHQSLAGLFNSASYDSETKRINFYDKSNVLSSYIDATAFIKDGMVERVYITGSTLVVSFNTDAGTEDIELDLTDVFDPANYYTKDQIDALMANETARTENTYLKEHQSLANYYNKGQIDGMFSSAATLTANAIDAAETRANAYAESVVDGYATEQYVDDAIAGIAIPTDYATQEDIDAAVQGLASEQYVDDAIAAIPSPDLSEYATHSEVENAVGDVVQGLGMIGLVNDVSANGGTVTVRKTGMENGQIVTGSTSFNIVRPEDLGAAMDAASAWTDATYAKKTDIPSLENYATEAYVDNAIATETARTESTYLKEHQSLADYYTKADVDSRLQDKADRMDVISDIEDAISEETARTENVYAKKSEIPSLNGYATEAWVEGKGYITGVTIDDELTSGSTNAVQSKAIYEAINGVSSSTQMTISEVTSNSIYASVFMSGFKNCYLKETNIPGYYVLDINQTVQDYSFTGDTIRLNGIYVGTTYNRVPQIVYLTTENYGDVIRLTSNGTNLYFQVGENYMDNFNYYLIYNSNDNSIFFSKTVPVITEVTGQKADVSDIPTAQDNRDFNQFVYNDTTNQYSPRKVISSVSYSLDAEIVDTKLKPSIQTNLTYWDNQGSNSATFNFPYGSESMGGIKTPRDSKIINTAEDALSGFTEEITLTIGSASTDSFNLFGNKYFYETNDPRYIAYPVSELNRTGLLSINYFTIDGNRYGALEANSITSHQEQPIVVDWRSSYHLIPGTGSGSPKFQYPTVPEEQTIPYVQYIIVDKEAKTLIFSDTLTLARAKNIQEALDNIPAPDMSDYVSKDELTGSTEQQAIEIGVDDAGVTISVYGPNGLETLNLKSTSVNKYKVLDISGWATGNVWPQYFTYSGSQMGFQDFVVMALDTPYTLTQGEGNHSQITFSGTSPRYIVLNIEDNTVYVSDNLPSVVVEVPGVLDDYAKTTDIPVVPTNVSAFNNDAGYLTQHQSLANYYNKTEIDNMVGDIESLLANI